MSRPDPNLRSRDLLVFADLSAAEKKREMATLRLLRGDLAQHADQGEFRGVVFGWRSLAQLAERFTIKEWLFRGHTTPQLELRPVVGRRDTRKDRRTGYPQGYSTAAELRTLNAFKRRCRSYLTNPPANDFEWLAVGRHHGLPTRLLDWSENFLVAAMFACKNGGINSGKKSTPEICAIRGLDALGSRQTEPFKLNSVRLYRPPHIAGRIPAQHGVFTVHPKPERNFRHPELQRWLIWTDCCFSIKKQLDVCGINESTLFPDIDGLASYLSWMHKWGFAID